MMLYQFFHSFFTRKFLKHPNTHTIFPLFNNSISSATCGSSRYSQNNTTTHWVIHVFHAIQTNTKSSASPITTFSTRSIPLRYRYASSMGVNRVSAPGLTSNWIIHSKAHYNSHQRRLISQRLIISPLFELFTIIWCSLHAKYLFFALYLVMLDKQTHLHY